MTLHLLAGSFLLAVIATTVVAQLAHVPMPQPAVAMAQHTSAPGQGFEGAFGRGSAVRNLIF